MNARVYQSDGVHISRENSCKVHNKYVSVSFVEIIEIISTYRLHLSKRKKIIFIKKYLLSKRTELKQCRVAFFLNDSALRLKLVEALQ